MARGRKPIGERAMTAAERQRRRRQKLVVVRAQERLKAKLPLFRDHIDFVDLLGIGLEKVADGHLVDDLEGPRLQVLREGAELWLKFTTRDPETFPPDDLREKIVGLQKELEEKARVIETGAPARRPALLRSDR